MIRETEPTSTAPSEALEISVTKLGPSSNMKSADPALKNQLMHQNTLKTPSMVFLENKRKIGEETQQNPQPNSKKLGQ
jgi:hypothetical protein